MTSRILVTGARGFIARHTLQPLIDSGFEVHALTTRDRIEERFSKLQVEWHTSDLLERDTARNLVEHLRPTHVLHAAWITEHGKYWVSDENLLWLAATSELIHTFARTGGERFVNLGTCAEYEWAHDCLVEDKTPEVPATLYGATKLAVHNSLMASANQFGFGAATGRVFFCYGPHESEQRVVPHACRKLARKELAEFSSGTQIRDFMHVKDVGSGVVALVNSEITGACNVSSGEAVSLAEIVHMLGEISDARECIRLGVLPDRDNDPPSIVGSNVKLTNSGWSPAISLRDGLSRTYDWWQEHESS